MLARAVVIDTLFRMAFTHGRPQRLLRSIRMIRSARERMLV